MRRHSYRVVDLRTPSELVAEFHRAVGHPVRTIPTHLNSEERVLAWRLIAEELEEYDDASCIGTVAEVAKELADLAIVVYGAAHRHGIPLDAVISEVHKSNMTKVGAPTRPDGKLTKGPNYVPPDIKGVLAL